MPNICLHIKKLNITVEENGTYSLKGILRANRFVNCYFVILLFHQFVILLSHYFVIRFVIRIL